MLRINSSCALPLSVALAPNAGARKPLKRSMLIQWIQPPERSMPIQPPQIESKARITSGPRIDQGLSCA
jgi:hypothetical protein